MSSAKTAPTADVLGIANAFEERGAYSIEYAPPRWTVLPPLLIAYPSISLRTQYRGESIGAERTPGTSAAG